MISVPISWLDSILSKRAFSTLRILPRRGRIAWARRSRPCFAEPPAESPSTRNSSDRAGSVSWQSASLPGSIPESSAPLRRVNSFALRAASRARSASSPFSSTFRAIPGFSSKHADSFSFSIISTMPLTSLFPSLVFVWPSNCGRGSLTLMTAVSPSRTSSPDRLTCSLLIALAA